GWAWATLRASFQYRARTLPTAVSRLGSFGGVVALGSVNDRQAWETDPSRPRELAANRPAKATGTRARTTSTAIPARRRSRSDGGRAAAAKRTQRPATVTITARPTTIRPSRCPEWVLAARATLSALRASWWKVQRTIGTAPSRPRPRTARPRRRRGTLTNQKARPIARARRAPRE